ncbi:MAG: hypothetical protein MJZ73_09335 [Bacteroidaceae bacterium]|nr:hypothetical protein [Bacteroidaceae bacterium]
MKNPLRKVLKILAIAVATVLLLLVLSVSGAYWWFSRDEARQLVFEKGIGLLQEKLQTRVSADSVRLEVLRGQVHFYGVQINDRQDSLLMHIGELRAGIDPQALRHRIVKVSRLELRNADVRMWRDSLQSNFQFVADAFRKKPDAKPKKQPQWVKKWKLEWDVEDVVLQQVHARWDVRNKVRKNLNKPHRGAFDANHLDATLNLRASLQQSGDEGYRFIIKEMNATDSGSGLQVDRLTAQATLFKDRIETGNVLIQMAQTEIRLQPFTLDLKEKLISRPFILSANVLLSDLAQPFAPDLENFTTPLQLTTLVSGPLDSLRVEDIHIQSPDEHFDLKANGSLAGLFRKAPFLNLQFRDIDLKATHSMKEQLVMHFSKKMRLKMIRQMKAIGDIRFQGSLDVRYLDELISGRLSTRFGEVNTTFSILNKEHKMIGNLVTSSLEIGKLMNIPLLGPANCRIDFDLNISKKTPRPASALPNGRLPLGSLKAWVNKAQYSSIVAPEVCVDLQSDGSTASGKLWMPGQLESLQVDVKYIQTDDEQTVWFQSTREAQQWLLRESVDLLRDRLGTDVEADSIDVHLLDGEARLYGIRMKDQQNKPFFSMDTLSVSLDAQELLERTVHITHLGLYGIDTHLSKDARDANFRFLFQAFNKHRKPKKTVNRNAPRKRLFELAMDVQELLIERMHVTWNVTDKMLHAQDSPNAGIFDPNHVDLLLNMRASARSEDNNYMLDIKQMSLNEQESGLKIDSLRTRAVWDTRMLHLDSLYVRLPNSWIHLGPLAFDPEDLGLAGPLDFRAHVRMQDISDAFAPAFSQFTTPVNVKGRVGGNLNNMFIDELEVHTPGNGFNLRLEGDLNGLRGGREAMNLQLRNIDLQSDNPTLMQLVDHFSTKMQLKMIRQMQALGNIHFDGKADVLPGRENISGNLSTEYGDVETAFTINGRTRLMNGYLEFPALALGKFLNVRKLGTINGHVDFLFNLDARAARSHSALPNGRLPQGNLRATVHNARYGKFRVQRIEGDVESDGSTATGTVKVHRKLSNLTLKFNYIQTDEEQRLKVKPKFRLHLWRSRRSRHPFEFRIQDDEGTFVPVE